MVTMSIWALLAMIGGGVLVGSFGVCMLIYYGIRDDRAERAKAKRKRDHRRTKA